MASKEAAVGATYFQADNDELLGEDDTQDETNQPLWRGDPEYTHSDWTIVVNEENTYHVHKNFLSAGPRSCNYFATLFQTSSFSELQENTSRITIPTDQAEAFPIMLDFVYSSAESDLGASTDNAVTLRGMARYFGCTALMKSVTQFIQKDLSTMTAVKYLHNAFLYSPSEEQIEVSARRLIWERNVFIPGESIATLPYECFRSLICSPEFGEYCASGAILTYFTLNPDALNARSLNELTDHLSEVDEEHALGLMKLTAELVPHEQDETSLVALNKLCKLCAKTLSMDWSTIDTQKLLRDFHNPVVAGDYRGSGRVVVSRLAASLEQAKKDYSSLQQADKRSSEKVKQLRDVNKDQKKEIRTQKDKIDALEARNARLEADLVEFETSRSDQKGSSRRLKRTRTPPS